MAKQRPATERKVRQQDMRSAQDDPGNHDPLGAETAAADHVQQHVEKQGLLIGSLPMSEAEFNAGVARKAFELFERRGSDSGRDVEDWLEAERIVKDEVGRESRS